MKIAFSVNSSMIKRSIYTLVVPFFLVCKRWMREQTRSGLLTFVPLGHLFWPVVQRSLLDKAKVTVTSSPYPSIPEQRNRQ